MTITGPVKSAAAAAVAVAVLATGALAAASVFGDVAADHPAAAEIAAAHQIGVFQGYRDGDFRPDGKLTQAQAEKVIRRIPVLARNRRRRQLRDHPRRRRGTRDGRTLRAQP